jgi:hypothetical protein
MRTGRTFTGNRGQPPIFNAKQTSVFARNAGQTPFLAAAAEKGSVPHSETLQVVALVL